MNKVSCAETFREGFFGGDGVDGDDFYGSDHSGALDDVESDTAASENGDGRTGAHLRSVGYGSETGDNATTDEGGVFE